ncbi:MAG: hydroxyacid dehydrogenase [Caldilineaceae bacterium]|nr:hydroxyacid dehydrogenase [Caldilineaceae bacterium]
MNSLTHVWIEVPVLSNALDKLTGVTALYPPASAQPAQAILASSGIQYNAALFEQLPNLRIVTRTGIGIDNVNLADATAHGVVICNTPDGPTESTAEHAVAMLLALAKRIKQGDANMAEGKFGPRSLLVGTEVQGKTLGLVGLGRIGRRVAQICGAGLGMRVIGSDPFISAEQAEAMGVSLRSQAEVIAEADFLSLHAPAIPETYRMINRESIARMKDGAYLINVARGPLVDEIAVLEAVNGRKLAGVALDVFDPEPALVDSPLRSHPNILVTPHTASLTAEGRTRIEQMAVDRLIEFFSGQRPKDICNPEVWDRRR